MQTIACSRAVIIKLAIAQLPSIQQSTSAMAIARRRTGLVCAVLTKVLDYRVWLDLDDIEQVARAEPTLLERRADVGWDHGEVPG